MDFSPDGSLIATANDNRVSLFEREHQWLIRELRGHTARVEAVAFGPAGKILASGTSNGELATWDVATGALIKLRTIKGAVITGVKFMSAGKILTADRSGTVRLWDDGTCQDSCTLAQIDGGLESLAISMDDKWIAAGDENNTVTVWQFDISATSAQLYHSLTLPDKRADDSDFVRGLAFDKTEQDGWPRSVSAVH